MDAVCDVGFWLLLLSRIGIDFNAIQRFLHPYAQMTFRVPGTGEYAGEGHAQLSEQSVSFSCLEEIKKNNWGLRIALGAYDLYGITGWLSDILVLLAFAGAGTCDRSYRFRISIRWEACLADGIIGAILFAVVFVIGHAFNIGY